MKDWSRITRVQVEMSSQ